MVSKETPSLEYQSPRHVPPLSNRAVACFVFAVISVPAMLVPLFFRNAGPLACGAPVGSALSIVYGVMAFSKFPDDRGVMYRGRWMAVAGLSIAIALLVGLVAVIYFNTLERV